MDGSVLTSSQRQNLQTPARRVSAGGSHKDLWSVTRQGSFAEVDSALALLKKIGGNVDLRNMFGLTPLHIATWRNHIPVVRRLLAASADPDARDGESGWSSIHRALHFGHLAVANILLQSGASLTLEDSKSRTPVDLLSGSVSQVVGSYHNSVSMEVFSWGSGTNYQLGTGNAHIQKLPCKIDALQGSYIKLVSAAKFHRVAIGAFGEFYTWGFGRGGRLGHPDFDIHSEGDSFELRKTLPFCAGLLLRLLKRNLRVFVTCTTGFDRSPACIVAYLNWMQDTALQDAYNFVAGLHPCRPNRPAIVWATWDLIAMAEKDDGPPTHAVTFV